VSPKNARTARFRHALETSAVEIATRCLYLNEHSRISPENVIVISERPFYHDIGSTGTPAQG